MACGFDWEAEDDVGSGVDIDMIVGDGDFEVGKVCGGLCFEEFGDGVLGDFGDEFAGLGEVEGEGLDVGTAFLGGDVKGFDMKTEV